MSSDPSNDPVLAAEAAKYEQDHRNDTTSVEQIDKELREIMESENLLVGDVSNRHPSGGLLFDDQKMIDLQRRVVWEAVKEMGWNVMSGKNVNIISVSLPVRIFEPRSFLQRLSDGWSCAPTLLTRAAEAENSLERFKLVAAFAMAGIHNSVRQWKPFNPILGETYQAMFSDGTQVYLEQSSHHPPISHFQVIGPDEIFKVYGYAEFSASWRGNALKGSQSGPNIVEFKDGTRISYSLPYLWLRGILYGERVAEYLGEMIVKDDRNKLYCKLAFDPQGVGYIQSFFMSRSSPSDLFSGDIYHNGTVVDELNGSWIGKICSNGHVLYDIQENRAVLSTPVSNPLPSDSRFREDLLALTAGNFTLAQEKKLELEELQRTDRANRKLGYEIREEEEGQEL